MYTGEEHKIVQETRRWDAAKGKTIPMRSKEEAHDYRYFPEPDIVPLYVGDEIVKNAKETLPELPQQKRERFLAEYQISEEEVDILISDKFMSGYYEELVMASGDAKSACNWMLRDVVRVLNDKKIEFSEFSVPSKDLGTLIKMIKSGKINSSAASKVFQEMVKTGKTPEVIVEEKGLIQVSDTGAIEGIVDQVLAENQNVVEQFKSGNEKVKGFLVGQVMKLSKGKANPKMASDILDKKLK